MLLLHLLLHLGRCCGSDDTAGFTGTDKPDPAVPGKPADNIYRFNATHRDQAP